MIYVEVVEELTAEGVPAAPPKPPPLTRVELTAECLRLPTAGECLRRLPMAECLRPHPRGANECLPLEFQ
jgi:hypothetical protein